MKDVPLLIQHENLNEFPEALVLVGNEGAMPLLADYYHDTDCDEVNTGYVHTINVIGACDGHSASVVNILPFQLPDWFYTNSQSGCKVYKKNNNQSVEIMQ